MKSDESMQDQIEALLFISARPLSIKKLAAVLCANLDAVKKSIVELTIRYNDSKSGLSIVNAGSTYQMTTSKEVTKAVAAYNKEEVSGELTKPSLEALTIIAYRGPIKRAEVEQIRGVNCSVIIRNLLIRGLIDEETKKGDVSPSYTVSTDFIKYIGLNSIQALPEYDSLSSSIPLEKFLEATNKASE